MNTEHWVLYLDDTLAATPWPWAGRTWQSLMAEDVAALPHATRELLRAAPSDGIDLLVPEHLPREAARCVTHLALYYDDDSVYVFIQSDRPQPTPELADMDRDDMSCVFQLGGLDRGLYLGLNQLGEHIATPCVFDDSLQLPDAPRNWPFDGSPGRLSTGYDGRAIRTPTGVTGTWRVDKQLLASGVSNNRIRFAATRRCYLTNELVAWGTSVLWRPRCGLMGTVELVQKPTPAERPHVRRIDALYDAAKETALLRVHWHDLWSADRMTQLMKSAYREYLGRYAVVLNGEEQVGVLTPDAGQSTLIAEHTFPIADGWNRLEILSPFAGPKVVGFQKFSGNRLVSGVAKGTGAKPGTAELCAAFSAWHEGEEKQYQGGGVWGPPVASEGRFNISHNGAFHAEPYALACLHLRREDVYVQRVKEFCERALLAQHAGGWFSDIATDPDGKTPFYSGAFDTGSAGYAMLLGYRVLNDRRLLDASRRIIDAYRLYRFETNQNYAAFAVWHLTEHFHLEPDERILKLAVYYCRDAARAIDLGGAQDGHNFYATYGGITLKGLAMLLTILPQDHPDYAMFRDRTLRMANQMLARQQADGRFAERNRKYIGFYSLAPGVGLLEVAGALGGQAAAELQPAILAAYRAQTPNPDGGIIARLGRGLNDR